MVQNTHIPWGDENKLWSRLRPQPLCLSADEVNAERDPLKRLSPPERVVAWLHFPTASGIVAVQLAAEVDQYNTRVVHLRGTFLSVGWTCFVWANAVTRLQPRPRSGSGHAPRAQASDGRRSQPL